MNVNMKSRREKRICKRTCELGKVRVAEFSVKEVTQEMRKGPITQSLSGKGDRSVRTITRFPHRDCLSTTTFVEYLLVWVFLEVDPEK